MIIVLMAMNLRGVRESGGVFAVPTYAGFPVLGSILAKDGYLPRQLYTRGDRLAYSNGIVALAAVAVALLYSASVTALIQLYVVGVFVSFTVSQTGMMRHWTRHLRTETDRWCGAR
jgi:amino acid transporter